jgi:hypothetical protein
VLQGLDDAYVVIFATDDAMQLDRGQWIVDHVIPMKRIVIEAVDPREADPRPNSASDPIAGGPAISPEHLISIFDPLLIKRWVTADERDRLNRTGRSFQWDAADGDGWSRYKPPQASLRTSSLPAAIFCTIRHPLRDSRNQRSSANGLVRWRLYVGIGHVTRDL